MICYASRTGTRRNLEALRQRNWRLLVSRAGEWRHEGFPYGLDNGAWADFQQQRPFDEDAFDNLLDRYGTAADWVVLPDIVAGGLDSLRLSTRWLNRCRSVCDLVLIAVQDGMTEHDVAPIVGPHVGIFLGGSTEWKLKTMLGWGAFCRAKGVHYHVGRVNTCRRFSLAAAASATSVDGSSATRYATTLHNLDLWSRQPDLFAA